MLEKWVSKNVNLIITHFGSLNATDVCYTGHFPTQICSNCFDSILHDATAPMITRCFSDRMENCKQNMCSTKSADKDRYAIGSCHCLISGCVRSSEYRESYLRSHITSLVTTVPIASSYINKVFY